MILTIQQESVMSKKFAYKGKLWKKVHQLQKRITRTEENPGHSEEKLERRNRIIHKLLNRIREK